MDESSSSPNCTSGHHAVNIPNRYASLASMAPALVANSKLFIGNVNSGNQETVSSTLSNNLRLSILCSRNRSQDEHQTSGNGNVRQEASLRIGHRKSRRGCYNCKRRRVKCPENHPICTQCTRRGLKCEWPELYVSQAVSIAKEIVSIPPQIELPTPVFTPLDFRLFHYFICDAYPVKPIENESIWTHEIPSMAHNYNYLLHAMLALSASDLEATEGRHSSELAQSAMSHRILAIGHLNHALSSGLHSFEEGNAMLATCWILLYQSTMIEEGLSEYLTFVRGCVLVPIQMSNKGLKFLFQNLLSNDEIEKTRPFFQRMPAMDLAPVNAAYASMEAFWPLCAREADKKMHQQMLEIIRSCYSSSCDAYMAWLKGSVFFSYSISHAEFLTFIDPSNLVGQLLQSHLVAIQTLIASISHDERGARKELHFLNGMVKWLQVLHASVEPSNRTYFEWPIRRAEEVREWIQQKKSVGNRLKI